MNMSFTDLFEEQVSKTPDNVAVVFEGEKLSYQQLNERSNMLANFLRSKGVKEDTLVPLFIERGVNMLVAMLGIMKAGAAYVPIDADFPVSRITHILEDTAASIVLSSVESMPKLAGNKAMEIVALEKISGYPKENLSTRVQAAQLAYVIYTSGSTGMPKGVMVEHRNLVDYITGLDEKIQVKQCRSFALVSTIATDLGNTVIYGSLVSGGALHLFTKESVSNIELLHQYFTAHKIECLKIVPSHWKVLNLEGRLLLPEKLLIFGGEALPGKIVEDIHSSGTQCRIVNHYGPTETTIGKLLHVVQPGVKYEFTVPIGKPFSNTKVLVLTKNLKLCPIGVPGQLYITGDGIARGYLNNIELTREKFIQNPFSKQVGSLMYSTGDLVKYLPDGNISFIGRVDNQVKIRGYRIELGEIENMLLQCNLVSQAVVLAKEDKQGDKRLVAYIVPEGSFDKDGILSYVKDKLPEYMVPALFMEMDNFPLTPNGKIDRNALPDPDATELLSAQYVAPRNDVEAKLAALWQDVLEVDQVGMHDDFFELGGHSLLAVRLVSAIRKAFVVEMPISDIFDYPTVALLSAQLSNVTDNKVLTTIEAANPRPPRIPLSFSQERLWFIDHLEGSVQYHVPAVLRLKGKLDREALIYTLQQIVNRHEVLRTVILEDDGQPYQYIKDKDKWELSIEDNSALRQDPKALQQYVQQLIKKPFNLSKDYLLRASLVNIDEEENVLIVVMHHIASDAWSAPVLVKEVVELYNAYVDNRTATLSPLGLQYADYSIWQRNYLQGEVLEKKLDYWKEKLQDLAPLQLPTDFSRPSAGSIGGAALNFKIDKVVADKLQDLSHQQGATLFMTLLAAFKVLLYRYSGQQDISVGTSIANRTQQEMENLVGFFVNTLALRSNVNSAASFTDLLQHVKATTMDAYGHQDVPFEKVVEAVVKERDKSRSPLFQVMLVLRNTAEAPELKLGEVTLSGVPYELTTSKFDITFFVTETALGLQGSVQYSTDLYKASTIERMMAHFTVLLSSIISTPHEKVGVLPILSNAEENTLLKDFGIAKVAYPKDKSIVDLFEEQAIKNPENIALVFENATLSYRELNERSNQLAHYLRNKGVKEGTLVPLYMERGIEMMIAIIGIMKSGGAYVPVDTDFPVTRITYMLKDTAAAMVVCSNESRSKLPEEAGIEVIEFADVENQPVQNPTTKVSPNQLAYVIYTSGSTGQPKGVMIDHRNLVDYVFGLQQKVQVNECRSFALVSTIATDLGNTVIYSSLVFGGTLHLFSKEAVSNIEYLHRYFSENRIDCLKIVPSHWKALSLEDELLLPVKLLIFGGEALQSGLLENIIQSGYAGKVVNHYGPTETTIGKLVHITSHGTNYNKTIPIGKPFSNTKVYILSKDLQVCPVGIPGQLYIAGDGIAKGYLNNSDLTKEKFITDPFSSDGSRMYSTGDLVRYLADGNIEFIGRADDQVKIRGYRVEPGEIESVLQQCEFIRHAVVLATEDKQGNKKLVGYIVPIEDFDREEIMNWAKEKLPEYMVPATFVQLDELPLTANGKVDRKALPDPEDYELLAGKYVAPRNNGEARLAAIWQDVLEIDQVGVHDDFFELGGHSLLAVRLISAIRREFVVEMPISDIFDYPTVALLASQLDNQANATVLPVIQVSALRPKYIPLSFSQERLWFIHRLEGSVQYHVPAVLRLKGDLNRQALQNSLQNLVNRHEVLRTVILEEEGRPYQHILDKDAWQLSTVDGSVFKDDPKGLQAFIKQVEIAPFDLSKDHMIRAHLIILDENEYVLIVTLHHIASDGWSKSVLVREFLELYNAKVEERAPALPVLGIQYADFAIWQRRYLDGEVFEKKLSYWKDKLKEVAPLKLPADHARPAVWSTRGASVNFAIEPELAAQVRELSQQNGATIFMTLLAAFKVLLYRYSNQQDICIGTAIAGRQQQELEGLIGFFVNTLALRSEVNPDASFTDFLQQVKKTTMDAYKHQEVPFEKVVDAVLKDRSLSKNPLVQVMFALLNTPEVPELRLGEIKLARESFEHTSARFDLTFFVNDTPQGIHGSVEYSTDLYNEDTIVAMVSHFKELLYQVVMSPAKKIGQLSIISKAEADQLLHQFNQTNLVLPAGKTVVDLFETVASQNPDAVALIFGEEKVTYKELNERSNQLAHYLISKGVTAETLIPVCMERSVNLIIGVLGILKSGAAYVPIDPGYPEDRTRFMLEDTGAGIIISVNKILSTLPATGTLEIISLNGDEVVISNQPVHNPHIRIDVHHLANVIYTSGSTGVPKGVLIEHLGLVNLITWHNSQYKVSERSRSTTMAGVGFDAFGWEIWPYLSIGAALLIIDDDTRLYPSKLLKLFNSYEITHSFMATALVQEFVQLSKHKTTSLQFLLTGGDKLLPVDIDGLNYRLVNNYGPTENTVVSTSYELQAKDKSQAPPIGAPVANTRIYILDGETELAPIGVAGEICISGTSLARGYLNRVDLTGEKFVADPFSDEPGLKMYRTGDVGRWLRDGNIEYLGRKDDQVKIRGYRIELGEIESVLQQTGLVSHAVVLAKENKEGDKRLLGYMVPDWDVVKAKELELYRVQIAGWKELYENEYGQTEGADDIDVEFNIIGWNDSFTKAPIPAPQMREWLNDIVEVILSGNPSNVLEIGSGTGLIYYQLAGKVQKYLGTDLSRSSISQIEEQIAKGQRNYGHTELKVCAAHEISLKDNEQVDTVVINSVVQYFPGEDYLTDVIRKSISLLKGNGRVIIGDVRDNRLLGLFKSRLLLQRLQDSVSIKEFKWAVEQDTFNEEELCFSPDYFYKLADIFPEIAHVEIQWKASSFINELTLYRYNVVLHVGSKEQETEPAWRNWSNVSNSKLSDELRNGVEVIALKDVPNPRHFQERLLTRALMDLPDGTVGDLAHALLKPDEEALAVEQVLNSAIKNGYQYRLLPDEDPLKVNVLIELKPTRDFIKQAYSEKGYTGKALTNIPLFSTISALLQKDIRSVIQQRLPEYMVPSELNILGHLPLTSNGKIDRKFLSQREDKTTGSKLNYEAPRTEVEQVLASIWQDLLVLERVGIHDNFFELGGHSLLATRAVSAVRKRLYVELGIKDLFVHPTIAELALHLNAQSSELLLPALDIQSRPDFIPLSFSQERLWFIDRLEGSLQYHMPVQLRLKGNLDKDALVFALQNIVNRHEVLRTVFLEEDGIAHQQVMPENGFELSVVDGSVYKDNTEDLQKAVRQLINDPFDLASDHMLRATLITLNEREHLVVVTMHHIASDGWSISIIVKEVVELYNSCKDQRPAQLAALPVQYADYAIWQRKYLQGDVLQRKISYWKEKLNGVAPLQLPINFPRPAVQSTRGSYTTFRIEKEILSALISLSQQQGATLFMTLLAAFKVLLHRYSGQQDICIGTPIAGRQQQEVEELIGFFINTLALRTPVDPNASFINLLQEVKNTTLEAYAHQDLPFEKVVDVVVKERDMSRSPLFQAMFILQNTPDVPTLHLGEVQLIREAAAHNSSKFELTFNLTQNALGLQGSVEYCVDLFEEETINRLMVQFKELLSSITKAPGQKVGGLKILGTAEEHQLLTAFNSTHADYPLNKTLVDLFEEQVIKVAGSTAVIFENETLSYGELNKRSNQVAHYLKARGVIAETLVPICINRSLEMIVAILAVLKAGGAYVPIDPGYPSERISFMLENTGAGIILSGDESYSKLQQQDSFEIINLNSGWSAISEQPNHNLSVAISPSQLAYVIYTSGSTGQPKGAMNEHQAVVNRLCWAQDYYKLTPDDAVLQKTSFSFDVSVWELLWPLLAGAKLVFASVDGHKDNEYLKTIIAQGNITMMHFVPSMLGVFLPDIRPGDCKGLKKVLCSGEALKPWHVAMFREKLPHVELHNLYGPTEAAIDVTYWSLSENFKNNEVSVIVPIGKPVANTSIYILDDNIGLVPIGGIGQIHIGGVQVGRGYLNRPELTAEKFVPDPFNGTTGARMYKTGDIGRWLSDGNIEYLGRIDDQVKIRGYRIELGEIERILQQSGLVSQSVVLAKEDSTNNKKLVGYVVPKGQFDKAAVVGYLQAKLPGYMVPALWVEMEYLPLTTNGKINRSALPDPDAVTLLKNEYVAPRTELEEKLAEIWRELLGAEVVGIHDNFFELGGDSILTIQVVSRARRVGYELQPKDIFVHQTIARLSEAIQLKSASVVSGEQGTLTGSCGLLPIQQWYLENGGEAHSHFNQSVLLGIDKAVSSTVLSQALRHLVAHHDALRFKYSQKEGEWTQEYGTYTGDLVIEDLTGIADDSLGKAITETADIYQRKLDIFKGELIQMVWMQTPANEKQNRLLLVVHHLAIDGVSWRILIENLEFLLTGIQKNQKISLGVKSSSYRQWHDALKQYGRRKKVLSQTGYWEKVLSSYRPLGIDKVSTEPIRLKDMEKQVISLGSAETTHLLQEISKVYHTDINDMLLCALAITLGNWGNTEKVIIGLEGHGREDIERNINTSQTVGWFTSLYPVLIEISQGQGPGEAIKSVKEQLRQVPDKGLGYGVLKYINKEKKLQAPAHWHILFNYLGQLDTVVKSGQWFNGVKESAGQRVSEEHPVNEQLSVTGYIQGGQLVLNWTYNTKNYDEQALNGLVNQYKENLELLISHCVEQKSQVVFTPSDYSLGSEITYQELDKFLNEADNGVLRKDAIEGLYRLSGLQQGMLFHGLYDVKAGSYVDQFSCDLHEPDIDVFTQSWKNIIRHHSILRSAFYYDHFSLPVQCVYRQVELPVSVMDYRGLAGHDQEEAIKKYAEADRVKGFDFKSAPLMRLGLFRISDDKFRMLWTLHHILFDGWSLPILMEEFLSTYELLLAGKPLKPFKEDRFEDYIRYIERADKEKEESYWKSYMSGLEQSTLLPFIESSAERTKGAGNYKSLYLHLDEAITGKIKTYAQNHRLTVNTVMQGVWACLLHRYTGNTDIAYGVIVSGRPDDLPGVEQRVGMYINTLPLHSTKKEGQPVTDWLQQLQEEQVASRQYQFTPLQDIQALSGVKGDLFDSILVFENYPVSKVVSSKKWSLNVQNVQIKEQTNYPVSITIGSSDVINIGFSYNSLLLKEEYIKDISSHFENVVLQLVENETLSFGNIKLLTATQESTVLKTFNNTIKEYPRDQSIVDLFEKQVAATPDKIAIVFEQQELSYLELNERANQLAHYLVNKGIQQEELVPVCIERSPEMIIGVLGILKAGAAYVPFDAGYPAERINYLVEDTGAKMVITSKTSRVKLQVAKEVEILEIEGANFSTINLQPVNNLSNSVRASQLAYVIYTSGSTGLPKGVLIEHGNVVSLVKGVDYVSLTGEDVLLSTGSPSFDATTFEYWGTLLNGSQLVLCSESRLLDAALLKEEIAQRNVTIMWFTSSWFNQLVENDLTVFRGLQTILVGGEKLSEYHIQKIREQYPNIDLINGYGPTENTTFSLTYKIDSIEQGKSIPIGNPLNNRAAYILNEAQQPVPVGVTGEIYLGGAGLSRGYLNRPELSKEKFIQNPFSENGVSRLYKTGDLGRWLPEGVIEYQGRIDDQVKIRGFRIELGEIETVLLQSGLVSQSVIVVKESKEGSKRLVGYVVPNRVFDKEAVTAYLRSRLPEYMLPGLWVQMDAMPLTSNGKIDKKALPDPDASELTDNKYVAPRNELEDKLAAIWQQLLRVERVGITDNFFELGGHSLLVMRLVAAIRQKLELELSINDIFIYPTISDFTDNLVEKFKNPSLPQTNIKYLVPIKTTGNKIPLYIVAGGGGTARRFMKFAEMMDPDQPVYALQPPIDPKELEGFPDTIEKIAAKFIGEIMTKNPEGPYALSGHCLGGIIAFEMGRQLEAAGKKVHILAMFDTIIRKVTKREPGNLKNLFNIPAKIGRSTAKVLFKIDFETYLLKNHTRQAIKYKVNSFKKLMKKVNGKNISAKEQEQIGLKVFDGSAQIYVSAFKQYRLSPYNGEIILFYAKEHYYFMDNVEKIAFKKISYNDETKNLWRQYATSAIIHEVEGEHSAIFEHDQAREFANALQNHLNKPQDRMVI